MPLIYVLFVLYSKNLLQLGVILFDRYSRGKFSKFTPVSGVTRENYKMADSIQQYFL